MYYVVGLGKSGQAFLESFPQALSWDEKIAPAFSTKLNLTSPLKAPWEKIKALILSPGIPHLYPYPHPAASQAQKYNVPIWCDIEVFLQTYPSLFTIGITGTNGKSTTTALITHMLKVAGLSPLMGGNIGMPVFHLHPQTPGDICVLELSSYQLERLPSWKSQGKIGLITNITPDHLSRHGGIEGYIEAKKNILTTPQALIGIDTPYTQELYKVLETTHPCLIPVSVTHKLPRGISVQNHTLFEDGVKRITLEAFKKLPGLHNAQNMALAFGVGRLMGLSPLSIAEAFHSFGGLAHRLEWVGQAPSNIHFVNDSKATNASAAAQGLAAYDNIFWILGGQPKETGLKGLESFYEKVHKAYLIGEAGPTFQKALSPHIPTHLCGNLETAMHQAWHDANALGGGTILLAPACASWDQYPSFEARGDHFKKLAYHFIGITP